VRQAQVLRELPEQKRQAQPVLARLLRARPAEQAQRYPWVPEQK